MGLAQHYEPPEVAWLLPELEVGVEPELRPLEDEDEPELDELEDPELVEPELVEPELVEPELVEPELVPVVPVVPEEVEPDEPEGEEDEPAEEAVLCADPGRARASAPAVTTLAMMTEVVVERTLFRPRSLSAWARRIPSRCALLMYPILAVGYSELPARTFSVSYEPSGSFSRSNQKLPSEHEGHLKP